MDSKSPEKRNIFQRVTDSDSWEVTRNLIAGFVILPIGIWLIGWAFSLVAGFGFATIIEYPYVVIPVLVVIYLMFFHKRK